MKGYAISQIREMGIDLDQFDPGDWHYDPVLDVVLVRPASRIAVYLAIAIDRAWLTYYNENIS
jgi:hypothetical protein